MERVHVRRLSTASLRTQPLPALRRAIRCSAGLIDNAAEFRGPGVHHRIDDSPDDIDMDLDARFRPSNSNGGRIILLGDGTEISNEAPDSDMFDHDDEDKDLESQVDKYKSEEKKVSEREGTPGPESTKEAPHPVTESPSSVQTEKSDAEQTLKDTAGDKKPLVDTGKRSD